MSDFENGPRHWLVRKLDRLGSLSDDDRAALGQIAIRVTEVPKYRALIREGVETDECCVLVGGYACRYKGTPQGARQIVSFHIRGDILDVQHLMLARADHHVQAITAATVGWFSKAQLRELAWKRPAIGQALWRDSLIDASIFREWVLNVGRRDAKTRIAHMLCEFAARCDAAGLGAPVDIDIPMTQEQMADATGLTAVHVNRMLQEMRNDGLLLGNGKRFRILDWDGLRRLSDFDAAYLHAAA